MLSSVSFLQLFHAKLLQATINISFIIATYENFRLSTAHKNIKNETIINCRIRKINKNFFAEVYGKFMQFNSFSNPLSRNSERLKQERKYALLTFFALSRLVFLRFPTSL